MNSAPCVIPNFHMENRLLLSLFKSFFSIKLVNSHCTSHYSIKSTLPRGEQLIDGVVILTHLTCALQNLWEIAIGRNNSFFEYFQNTQKISLLRWSRFQQWTFSRKILKNKRKNLLIFEKTYIPQSTSMAGNFKWILFFVLYGRNHGKAGRLERVHYWRWRGVKSR